VTVSEKKVNLADLNRFMPRNGDFMFAIG
jgi:hypothetical protein